ncbi:dimethyl sulfoxide reductase anchor subunit [Moritella sp. 24]|uniref:DmsC/YnfH family molybdoenzyme membrane anchor subunit n=1 Tax=Moritella sp. 24 TaxID=2746230 RepID=UPI001BAB4FA0|nr:DmsC/YnfH family molybdoenzyme membrane anchor subunit [Moritella sp. 24]QUM78156.1 dimethyl sulfoxide reductase anchor subunit [Moritella sp. 24]
MLDKLEQFRDRLDQIGAAEKPVVKEGTPIFDTRVGEQSYAKLADVEIFDVNTYGKKIDLIERTEGKLPAGRSMNINENKAVGDNPNRNKQHAFHFTADNCIGCHACEAACSEKNDNPAHIAFRSVGYVESGSYPDYKRINISMACNHCDDPVCLKGCPTKAYTKHVEYGAVLQDPDTCFGCGYCTWVCPYNAPQLDPIKGQVSKCNMCVDRLEVGLKPACVSACLGNALNFGVVENTPENRIQAKTSIPGFPDPSITNPNIRFQQTTSTQREMTRTDNMPLKYHKQDDGSFRSVVDEKDGKEQSWNLGRLSSRENPLVIFTLFSQTAMGAFALIFLGPLLGIDSLAGFAESGTGLSLLILLMAMQAIGLLMSTLHLGKPKRFYRGFNNLAHSPVSREGLGVALFFGFMGAFTFFQGVAWFFELSFFSYVAAFFGAFALVGTAGGLYYMYRSYRIKARPFWDHWQTACSFVGSAIALGTILTAVVAVIGSAVSGEVELYPLLTELAPIAITGLVIEAFGLYSHAKHLNVEQGEGAASHYVQCTTFGKTYKLRNLAVAVNIIAVTLLALLAPSGVLSLLWLLPIVSVALAATVSRSLFYVLVIPTTMPGAFFWKNKGFEQHARDVGLADMPQVGVVPDLH